MYLVYIDESGNASFKDDTKFILSGVLIHESSWKSFERKILALKEEHFKDKTTEFHTSLIAMQKDDFSTYTEEECRNILTRMANIINKNRCTIISIIFEKDNVKDDHDDNTWIYEWAWRPLLERVEKYLVRRNLNNQTNYGLICMDNNNSSINEIIETQIRQFRERGSMVSNSQYLIENPFFVKSHMRKLIQLTDFVCWVARQWYLRKLGHENPYDEFTIDLFDRIKDRFDTGPNPDREILGYGIKIFPD